MQLPIPLLRGGLGIPLGFGTGWKKLLCEQIRVSIIHHMQNVKWRHTHDMYTWASASMRADSEPLEMLHIGHIFVFRA